MLKALWNRILGMAPRTEAHWRAWAIERAIESGAGSSAIWQAQEILAFVFPQEVGTPDA